MGTASAPRTNPSHSQRARKPLFWLQRPSIVTRRRTATLDGLYTQDPASVIGGHIRKTGIQAAAGCDPSDPGRMAARLGGRAREPHYTPGAEYSKCNCHYLWRRVMLWVWNTVKWYMLAHLNRQIALHRISRAGRSVAADEVQNGDTDGRSGVSIGVA